MKHKRWKFLMDNFDTEQLTTEEDAQGWHWCPEYDWLLIGPTMKQWPCCELADSYDDQHPRCNHCKTPCDYCELTRCNTCQLLACYNCIHIDDENGAVCNVCRVRARVRG
mgnify:CR=1 FL=1